ncbi:hypothetical protein [Bacillus cereus]|uniref:hypothetical protein n=1 Tax=Bacillus cereus TaxID=1396 RepID=UPI00384F4FE7
MEESTLSLLIVSVAICVFVYLVHRIDAWTKRQGGHGMTNKQQCDEYEHKKIL